MMDDLSIKLIFVYTVMILGFLALLAIAAFIGTGIINYVVTKVCTFINRKKVP